jgi:GAF domain-containing protein
MPSNILCIPFASENGDMKSTGVLCLLNRKHSLYEQFEIELLEKSLQMVALVINNFQLYNLVTQAVVDADSKNEKVLNELAKSKILLEFALSLYQEDNLSKLLENIIQRARDLLSADKASVFVVDKDRKEVIIASLKVAIFQSF